MGLLPVQFPHFWGAFVKSGAASKQRGSKPIEGVNPNRSRNGCYPGRCAVADLKPYCVANRVSADSVGTAKQIKPDLLRRRKQCVILVVAALDEHTSLFGCAAYRFGFIDSFLILGLGITVVHDTTTRLNIERFVL